MASCVGKNIEFGLRMVNRVECPERRDLVPDQVTQPAGKVGKQHTQREPGHRVPITDSPNREKG